MFYQNHNIDRLFEKKDHLIKRLDLTDDQKERLISFFNKYPNYESKIDWNNRNLTWEDFRDLLAMEGKSNSQAKKRGVEGLIEGEDYEIALEDETRVIYKVLTHRASRILASDKVGNNTVGKWCISMNDDHYWNQYTGSGKEFYFIIRRQGHAIYSMPEFNKIALCLAGRNTLKKLSIVRWAKEYYNPKAEPWIRAWNAEDHQTALTALPKDDCHFALDLLKKTREECQEIIDSITPKLPLEQRIKNALTGGPKMNFGTPQCTFHFNRPTENSLYVNILRYLKQYGPATKWNILMTVADRRNRGGGNSEWYRGIGKENLRGQYSGVYAAMHQAGLIRYNHGYVELGPNAELYMDYHKELFK